MRLQWDPDHHPSGSKHQRRAIQLGLKGKMQLQQQPGILHIEDVTQVKTPPSLSFLFLRSFTHCCQWVLDHSWKGDPNLLVVPAERVYPLPTDLASHIGASVLDNQEN